MIISELCPNGDLFDFIRNTPPLNLRSVVSALVIHGLGSVKSPLMSSI